MPLHDKAVAAWLRRLPFRWGVGGIVLAVVWSITSAALQGSYNNPAGGPFAALLRVLTQIVLPFGLLGFVWGWTEKGYLERSIDGEQNNLGKAGQRLILRQLVKAFCCGVAFGLFTYGLGLIRSFQPWDSASRVFDNIISIVAFGLLALPVGFVVGLLFTRKLERMQIDGANSLNCSRLPVSVSGSGKSTTQSGS